MCDIWCNHILLSDMMMAILLQLESRTLYSCISRSCLLSNVIRYCITSPLLIFFAYILSFCIVFLEGCANWPDMYKEMTKHIHPFYFIVMPFSVDGKSSSFAFIMTNMEFWKQSFERENYICTIDLNKRERLHIDLNKTERRRFTSQTRILVKKGIKLNWIDGDKHIF